MSETEKMAALVRLAGAVAHELNNIFTAVTGNLSLLEDHVEQGTTPAEMIEEAIRTAQRGMDLSAKLQAFAGRQPLQRKNVDINTLLDRVVRELRGSLPQTLNLQLTRAPRDHCIYVDETKLTSMICELIRNAVAAMNGSGQIRILTEERQIVPGEGPALRAGDYIVIRVCDTGPGMDPDIVARAMDPMFSTKASHINTGWGLSSSAGFVRQSGGTMNIFSERGQGTTIDLYLPVVNMAAYNDIRKAG
jgi:signal transduction histidine kinase